MKIQIPVNDLKDAVEFASLPTGRSQSKILNAVLLKAEDGKLEVYGTDIDNDFKIHKPANVIESGSICMEVAFLKNICTRFAADNLTVTISEEEHEAVFEVGGCTYRKLCDKGSEFPPGLNIQKTECVLKISGTYFLSALERLVKFASVDETRFVLNHIHFEVSPEWITAVATDGRQMFFEKHPNKHKSQVGNFLINRTIAERIIAADRLMDGGYFEVCYPSSDFIEIKSGQCKIAAKVQAKDYPKWRVVVPNEECRKIKPLIQVKDLTAALKSLAVASRDGKELDTALLHLESGKLTLKLLQNNYADAETSIAVNYDGKPFDIRFNFSRLLRTFAVFDGEVKCEFVGESDPMICSGGETTSVLMPCRPSGVVR